MFSAILPLAFLVLAGRVLGTTFNITVGTTNLTFATILDIPDSPVLTACAQQCNAANTTLQQCGDNAPCLCNATTVASLYNCEQCMFTNLITTNKPMPDFRAGSTPVLAAYSTACNATTGTPLSPASIALQVPPSWDGPFVAILPVPAAAISVVIAAFLGISAIFILSNM